MKLIVATVVNLAERGDDPDPEGLYKPPREFKIESTQAASVAKVEREIGTLFPISDDGDFDPLTSR